MTRKSVTLPEIADEATTQRICEGLQKHSQVLTARVVFGRVCFTPNPGRLGDEPDTAKILGEVMLAL